MYVPGGINSFVKKMEAIEYVTAANNPAQIGMANKIAITPPQAKQPLSIHSIAPTKRGFLADFTRSNDPEYKVPKSEVRRLKLLH